jgi:hypothetical protein
MASVISWHCDDLMTSTRGLPSKETDDRKCIEMFLSGLSLIFMCQKETHKLHNFLILNNYFWYIFRRPWIWHTRRFRATAHPYCGRFVENENNKFKRFCLGKRIILCGSGPGSTSSDVNVHKTNSFFMPNFQFVSISKQNVLCLVHCDWKENKMCFVQK